MTKIALLQCFALHQPKDELCCCLWSYVLSFPRDGEALKCYVIIFPLCTCGHIKINSDIYTEASGSRIQPKECRCYELRFSRGRWSSQTNTWLSEPQRSKVRRKSQREQLRGQQTQGKHSFFSFRWLDRLSVMNERDMKNLKHFKCCFLSWRGFIQRCFIAHFL